MTDLEACKGTIHQKGKELYREFPCHFRQITEVDDLYVVVPDGVPISGVMFDVRNVVGELPRPTTSGIVSGLERIAKYREIRAPRELARSRFVVPPTYDLDRFLGYPGYREGFKVESR